MPTLIPVDNDPFAVSGNSQSQDTGRPQPQLIPVDHDPFAAPVAENKPVQSPQAVQQPAQPASQPHTAASEPGFMDRVKQDWDNKVVESQKMDANPAETGIEDALRRTGKLGASFVNDVTGEAAKSLYGMLPDGVKEKVSGGLKMVADSPAGKFGLQMAQKGAKEYQQWAAQNPRVAKDLEAVVDITSALPVGMTAGARGAQAVGEGIAKGAPLATKAATEATLLPTAGRVVKGIAAPSEAKQAVILGDMHKKANDTIENLKKSNVKFKPGILDPLKKELSSHPDLKTAGEAGAREQTNKVVQDVISSLESGDTSLNNLMGFRDQLSSVIRSGGQDGNAALKAQNMLTKSLDKIPEFKKYQREWSMYKTGQDVSEAMQLADVSPAKSRASFQKIVDSDYFNSFDPEVKGLIRRAASGTAGGKFLETVGILKKLGSGAGKLGRVGSILPGAEIAGALALGHPALAAGMAGSVVAGKGGELAQRALGHDVLKYLSKNQ